VRASDPITLLATRPVVTFSGDLSASDPQGALDLPFLSPAEPGRWTGSGTLALTPDSGAVALLAPAPADAAGARVARGPGLATVGIALLALAAAALAALALRLRRARGDDLELAVLAMEERRWEDALPHLDRLVARRPDDPVVLMDRAICLEESGRLGEAREGYEATLRVEPHNAEAHYYYARTLARLRMGTAALAHLSRALALDARLAELARKEAAFAGFQDHPHFRGLVR
jgi:tetratricopeptide (TPR) repeat protein